MTPQQYIEQELASLRSVHPIPVNPEQLPDEIVRLILSKKFRKWSASAELIQQIRSAVSINVAAKKPINFTFPHGAYKLWRLPEAPYPDWAELFAAMYYTAWLKPICDIYPPGVWFEYFVDDLILPKIDNISLEHVAAYLSEHEKILAFLTRYQPKNFTMSITRFESLFTSHEDFDKKLQNAIETFTNTNPHPTFTDRQLDMVALNAKPTSQQLADPQWKEKVLVIHDAYMNMKRSIGYYYKPEKIPVFNQPLSSGKFIAVGTTKTSVAKFWVGVGALKKQDDSYREYILSPTQLQSTAFSTEPVTLSGLPLHNFHSIRVFS